MITVKRKIEIRSVAHGARTLAVAPEVPAAMAPAWRIEGGGGFFQVPQG